MARNQFVNPVTGEIYIWPRNHLEERRSERRRTISKKQLTADGWVDPRLIRSVRQQGLDTLLEMTLVGDLPARAYHQEFMRWLRLCVGQTIHFVHYGGERFEVTMKAYVPQRRSVIASSEGERFVTGYSMELEVFQQIA